jgi:hypothetical protein
VQKPVNNYNNSENEIDWVSRLVIQQQYSYWDWILQRIALSDLRRNTHIAEDAQAKVVKQLIGIGSLIASTLFAKSVY